MRENPYTVLGILPNAGKSEIRSAFARRAKATHPDLNPGKPEAEYRRVYAAYQTLRSANFIYVPLSASSAPTPAANEETATQRGPTTTFHVGPSPFTMPRPTLAGFAFPFFQ